MKKDRDALYDFFEYRRQKEEKEKLQRVLAYYENICDIYYDITDINREWEGRSPY